MVVNDDAVDRLFRDTVCLAPMVRTGTLPMRLLALKYGADTVYGEELIDKRIVATTRTWNPVLETYDYVSQDRKSIVFRTCEAEKKSLVYQIGTSDPIWALRAAEKVAADVSAIDINMGCPKKFSIQGGMGAALLKTPQLAFDIIHTLQRNLNIPVSCKIRLLDSDTDTVEYARRMEKAGAVAIGVHGRQVCHRPVDAASWDRIAAIPPSVDIPVIANGDIFRHSHIAQVKALTKCSSVMIARGAILNASVFSAETTPLREVLRSYCDYAISYCNTYQNTKYNLSKMVCNKQTGDYYSADVTVKQINSVKNDSQLFSLFDKEEGYALQQAHIAKDNSKVLCESIETNHKYSDEFLKSNELYCSVCDVNLGSAADFEIHQRGKKHLKRFGKRSRVEEKENKSIEENLGDQENLNASVAALSR